MTIGKLIFFALYVLSFITTVLTWDIDLGTSIDTLPKFGITMSILFTFIGGAGLLLWGIIANWDKKIF